MDLRFLAFYQTVDDNKKMAVKAPDKETARNRAEEYLKSKYGEVFTIDRIEAVPDKPLQEKIVDHVFEQLEGHRQDCASTEEAEDLAVKINQLFEERGILDSFGSWVHERAVHVFPVFYVLPGSIRWKELQDANQTGTGSFRARIQQKGGHEK